MHIFLLLILIFLGGCVPIPPGDTGCMLSSVPSLDKSIEEGLEQKIIEIGDFPSSDWWEMFDDPQLSYLIEKGLCQSPTLHEAMARIKNAYEEAKIKRSALFPTVWFHAEADWQHLGKNDFFRAYAPGIPPNVTEYKIDLDFSYEFDFWGKWRNLYRAALGRARAECAENAQISLVISTAIAAAYFKLQTHIQELDLLREQQKTAFSLLRLREFREKHALDTIEERLAAEELLFVVDQIVLFCRQNVEIDKHLLMNLIGEGPDKKIMIDPISFNCSMKVAVPKHLSCNLLAHRPDLMAEIWRVEAAAYEVGAAKADFYPNINLCALAGLDSVFIKELFQSGSYTASATPAIYLPIFTAGRIRANLMAKRAMLEEAIFRYNQILLDAAKEVADQIVILKTADQNAEIQAELVKNRIKYHSVLDRKFQKALSNMLDVLEAKLQVLNQKALEIKAQYECRFAAIQLIKALGGGYHAACIPLSNKGF